MYNFFSKEADYARYYVMVRTFLFTFSTRFSILVAMFIPVHFHVCSAYCSCVALSSMCVLFSVIRGTSGLPPKISHLARERLANHSSSTRWQLRFIAVYLTWTKCMVGCFRKLLGAFPCCSIVTIYIFSISALEATLISLLFVLQI